MELVDIIRKDAARMNDVTVHVDSRYGTVEITDNAGVHAAIFMQGDDAADFINEAESLWDKAGEVTLNDCYLFLARAYVDCLWDRG